MGNNPQGLLMNITSLKGRMFGFVAVLFAAAILFSFAPIQSAQALDVDKCTARSNVNGGAGVLGATETRITWEAQAAADEALTEITLTMPAGTSFNATTTRVTRLYGEDLMERDVLDAIVSADGDNLLVQIPEGTPAGSFFRIEVYEVFFPSSGGDMQIEGTYTLKGGEVVPIQGTPAITVKGISTPDLLANWLNEQPIVQAWNSVKFFHLFLDPAVAVTSIPVVFWGFLQALAIVAIAFPLAIPVGLMLALMRMSGLRILRAIGGLYVNVVRGTPLFLQIYIAFFGLPLAGITPPPVLLGMVVLAMNSAAYLCEIFRAGIQSIPKGQFEASWSLGMNKAQTMAFVIIPQTVSRVIPTMTSEFILLYKDTSLLASVGIMEVVMYAKTIVASTGSITPYIVAALFYLVITLPLAKVVGNLEAKLANNSVVNPQKKDKKSKKAKAPKPVAAMAGAGSDSASFAVETGRSGFETFQATGKVTLKGVDDVPESTNEEGGR